jgi:hypothetical protein
MIVEIQVMNKIVMVNININISFFLYKKFEFLERICDPLTQFTCPHTPGKCIPNGMLKIKCNYF